MKQRWVIDTVSDELPPGVSSLLSAEAIHRERGQNSFYTLYHGDAEEYLDDEINEWIKTEYTDPVPFEEAVKNLLELIKDVDENIVVLFSW